MRDEESERTYLDYSEEMVRPSQSSWAHRVSWSRPAALTLIAAFVLLILSTLVLSVTLLPSITVAVFRCVTALPLSVMCCWPDVVTLCYLLSVVVGYPLLAAARSRVL